MKYLKRIGIHFLIAVGITAIGAFVFFNLYLPKTTHHGETLSVPDLESMSLKEAIDFLEKRNLRWAIYDSSFVLNTPPLTVISQNPKANEHVKESRRVYLSITPSKAPMVRLPDLEDITLASASRILKSYGLLPGKIRYKPDLAANVVLETWIEKSKIVAGDSLPKGSRVDLVIGDGKGTTRFVVPELVGLTQEEAEYAILGSGLVVGIVTNEVSEEPLGTVIRTYPSYERRAVVRLGDAVDLWVSGTILNVDSL